MLDRNEQEVQHDCSIRIDIFQLLGIFLIQLTITFLSAFIIQTTRLRDNLAVSTMLFSVLQVLLQVFFLTWHIYCVCFNIKTDEWINWRKYPEFRIDAYPDPEQIFMETHFTNPYDKGILHNWKEFLSSQEQASNVDMPSLNSLTILFAKITFLLPDENEHSGKCSSGGKSNLTVLRASVWYFESCQTYEK